MVIASRRKAKEVKAKVVKDAFDTSHKYKCLMCGVEHDSPVGNFYKSSSKLWLANSQYCPICKTCLNTLFNEYTKKYNSKLAIMICCHYMDVPFYHSIYETMVTTHTSFNIGTYASKVINFPQYEGKTFCTSLLDGEVTKSDKTAQEDRETQWSKEDQRNKLRVLRILKYDPFQDATDEQRKFMFNLTSDYLQDEGIIEDPHKLQGVIEIVKTYSQVNKINKQIDSEMDNKIPSEAKLKLLSTTKKDLMSLINTFAKNNGISDSLNNKGMKGSTSLAFHVKNLEEIDFTEAKFNLYDVKTCEAMRQFADISNQSIMTQLHLNSEEFGDMAEQQYRMIIDLRESLDSLKEENRLLKIEIDSHKNGG